MLRVAKKTQKAITEGVFGRLAHGSEGWNGSPATEILPSPATKEDISSVN